MAIEAGTRLGPHEIVAPIGSDGMGEVYRAGDTTLDRGVALETLPASFASDPCRLMRFEREAQTLAIVRGSRLRDAQVITGFLGDVSAGEAKRPGAGSAEAER